MDLYVAKTQERGNQTPTLSGGAIKEERKHHQKRNPLVAPTWNKERELAQGSDAILPRRRCHSRPKYHPLIPVSGKWKNRGPQILGFRYHSYTEVDHVGRGGVYPRGTSADRSGGVPGAIKA